MEFKRETGKKGYLVNIKASVVSG